MLEVSEQLAILDKSSALIRVGGDLELLRDMAQLFLEESPSQMEAIRQAVQTKDAKALERSAHSLKGSVGNFGAAATQQAAYRLEILGRTDKIDEFEDAYAGLIQSFAQLEPQMQALASIDV